MEAFSKSCLTAPRINPIESDGTSLLSAPCTPQLDESSGISDCSILHSILSMRLCQPQVLHIPQDSTNCFRHGCWTWSAGVNAVSIHWGGGGRAPSLLKPSWQDGGPVKTDTGCLSPGPVVPAERAHSVMAPAGQASCTNSTLRCVRCMAHARLMVRSPASGLSERQQLLCSDLYSYLRQRHTHTTPGIPSQPAVSTPVLQGGRSASG